MKKIITFKVLLAFILMSVGNVAWGTTVTWDPSTIFSETTVLSDTYQTSDAAISFYIEKSRSGQFMSKYTPGSYMTWYKGNVITFIANNGLKITKIEIISHATNTGTLRDYYFSFGGTLSKDKLSWSGCGNRIYLESDEKIFLNQIIITYDDQLQIADNLTITNAGYATYFNSQKYFMPNGLTGYIITSAIYKGTVLMEPTYPSGALVPSTTALLIKGTEGVHTLYTHQDAVNSVKYDNNMLHGDPTETSHSGEGTYYKLSYDNNGENLGFYIETEEGTSITNNAGKCYLLIPSTSSVKSISLSELEDNYILGVDYVTVKPQRQAYNIFGMPVKDDAKGIVIKNGKKYFNR